MEIITGRTGIKHVRAADDARIYRMLFGSGDYVLQDGNQLMAVKTGNNQITISDGFIMSQGRMAGIYADSGAEVISVDPGVSGTKREDTIVAEYNITGQGIESFGLKVIKGASGDSYVSPDIITGVIDNGEVHQVPLWGIRMDGYTMEDELIDYRNVVSINPIDTLYNDIETYLANMNAKVAELQAQYTAFTNNATTTFTNTINNKFNSLRAAYSQAGDKVWFGVTTAGYLTNGGTDVAFTVPIKPCISGASNPKLISTRLCLRLSTGNYAVGINGKNTYAFDYSAPTITNANGVVNHAAVKQYSVGRAHGNLYVTIRFKNALRRPDKKTAALNNTPIGVYATGWYQL